ncbi:MAG: hypothetical protein HRU26_06625 [Psychroserpens sp.]|nr:hypothetical protein [Psychroserpens sp.]
MNIYLKDEFKIQLFEDTSKYDIEPCEEIDFVLLTDYDVYVICETSTDGKKRSRIYTINCYKNSKTRIDRTLLLTNNMKRAITDPKLGLKKL